MIASAGLIDTSVLMASEVGRPIGGADLPAELLVSVVTIAELQAGVLAAKDTVTRSRRMTTLDYASTFEPLGIDMAVAQRWATFCTLLAEAGRKINVNDLWIASIAAANELAIVTQGSDFDPLEAVGGPTIIRV